MESEKKQQIHKREQIGTKLKELLPMEHMERRGNKTMTVAHTSDLKEQIISYVDDCDS